MWSTYEAGVVLHRECSRFCQVGVAEEACDGPTGVRPFLGARPGLPSQTGQALPQRLGDPFAGLGVPRVRAAGVGALHRPPALVPVSLSRGPGSVGWLDGGPLRPERCDPLPTACTAMQ